MDYAMTDRQRDYIETNRKRLHLGDELFARFVTARYGVAPADLDKAQAHDLIDKLVGWERAPAEVLALGGQAPLFDL